MLLEPLLLVASTLPLLQSPQLARQNIGEYLEDNADPDGNLWCGQTVILFGTGEALHPPRPSSRAVNWRPHLHWLLAVNS